MEGLWSENGGGAPGATTGVLVSSLLLSHVMIFLARHLPGGKNTHSNWSSLKWPPGFRFKRPFLLVLLVFIHWQTFHLYPFSLCIVCIPFNEIFLELLVAGLHFALHANDSFCWSTQSTQTQLLAFQKAKSCLSNSFLLNPLLNLLLNCLEGGREQVPGPGRSKVAHTQWVPTQGQLWSKKQKRWRLGKDKLTQCFEVAEWQQERGREMG